MAKRITKAQMREALVARVGRLDRSIFDDQIANALINGPTQKAWKKKANDDPEGWSRALLNLARMRGLAAERKEVVNFTPKLADVQDELVRRFGESQARVLLDAAGVADNTPKPIEGEATVVTKEKAG